MIRMNAPHTFITAAGSISCTQQLGLPLRLYESLDRCARPAAPTCCAQLAAVDAVDLETLDAHLRALAEEVRAADKRRRERYAGARETSPVRTAAGRRRAE